MHTTVAEITGAMMEDGKEDNLKRILRPEILKPYKAPRFYNQSIKQIRQVHVQGMKAYRDESVV